VERTPGSPRTRCTGELRQDSSMRVRIVGTNPPGRSFCRPDGTWMHDVHVGLQLGRDPAQLQRGDSTDARWECDVEVVERDGVVDFRGAAVQGKRGERFVYLTWGDLGDSSFQMFRRAKLMLDRIDAAVLHDALASGQLVARVDLTGGDGGPRCARVDPPAISWTAARA
jgi:Family of unknown function (DUF5990)